jgi:hypothetical protein
MDLRYKQISCLSVTYSVYVCMSSARDIYVNDLAGSEHRIARRQPTFPLHNHMRVGINVFIFRNEPPGVIFQAQPSVWVPVHPASCLCLSVRLFVTLHPVGERTTLFTHLSTPWNRAPQSSSLVHYTQVTQLRLA